jgi:hypothetical protein
LHVSPMAAVASMSHWPGTVSLACCLCRAVAAVSGGLSVIQHWSGWLSRYFVASKRWRVSGHRVQSRLNFWRRPVIFAVTVVPVRRSSFGVHGFDGSGQRPLGDAGDLTRPIGSAVLW